jgi:hypothetical protein
MSEYFTAKVVKVVKSKGQSPSAYLVLELGEDQKASSRVLGTIVHGARTKGESTGQLLPSGDGMMVHLVLDLGFVRKLKPGAELRVEWESRCGRMMTNIMATAWAPR